MDRLPAIPAAHAPVHRTPTPIRPVVRCGPPQHDLRRNADHFDSRRPERFSTYLKGENRKDAAVGPVAFDAYLKDQNREEHAAAARGALCGRATEPFVQVTNPESRPSETAPNRAHRSEQTPEQELPSLPPIADIRVVQRLELVYQIRVPFQPGRVIDVVS